MVFFMNCIDKIKPSRGRPIGTSRPSYALSKTQVRQLLGICCGSLGLRNRAIIALGIHSGARIGTIAKLTYEQIANKDGICKTSYVVQKHNEKSKRITQNLRIDIVCSSRSRDYGVEFITQSFEHRKYSQIHPRSSAKY